MSNPSNLRLLNGLRVVSRCAGCFLVALGLLVLMGWVFHIPWLVHILPGLVAMNPLTALGFVLSGIALWATQSDPLRRKTLAALPASGVLILAVMIVAIGAIRLIGYALHWSGTIDTALFHHSLAGNVMAPNTAACFVLIGMAFITLNAEIRGWRPAQLLGVLAGVVALLALIGYVYNATALFTVAQYIPMALHTAIGFAAAALGILCARPDREPVATITSDSAGGALARRLMPAAIILPVILGFVRLWGEQKGWWGSVFGTSLFVVALVLIFSGLIWWIAHRIYHMDSLRQQVQETLRQTELRYYASEAAAHEALKQAQSALVEKEKLAGLGQIVAGVAHEINNPLAFVTSNTAVLQRDLRSIHQILELYLQAKSMIAQHQSELHGRILALEERTDLAYAIANAKELLASSREGLHRIERIVEDLRTFSRLDQSDQQDADLNAGIASTVNIISGKARLRNIEISTSLGALPPVYCHAAKINQVLMNLLDNAIDACPQNGHVKITSLARGNTVEISVTDDGVGIDPAIQRKIFDPFFTTKPIGKGTGLGLSISYAIINNHGGRIDVQSTSGHGACFTVSLPLVNTTANAVI